MRTLLLLAMFWGTPALADQTPVEPEQIRVRPELPAMDTGGVDESLQRVADPAPAVEVAETEAVVSEAEPEYTITESSTTEGRIENGRRFVWAAYGVSWLVLLGFSYSVIRRYRDQLAKGESP
jgi:hypothetical protein